MTFLSIVNITVFQQVELSFGYGQDTFIFQLCDNTLESASIDTQIIRESGRGEWYLRGFAVGSFFLDDAETAYEFILDGALTENLDSLSQGNSLVRHKFKEIFYHLRMAGAGIFASFSDFRTAQEHYLAVRFCDYFDVVANRTAEREEHPENALLAESFDDSADTVDIVALHNSLTAEDDSDFVIIFGKVDDPAS